MSTTDLFSASRASTPLSDEDFNLAQRERYIQRIHELARVPEQIEHTYRDVWRAFYTWEPLYCESMLRGLRATDPAPSPLTLDDFTAPSIDFAQLDCEDDAGAEDAGGAYEQWFFGGGETIYVKGTVEEAAVPLPPCADYAYPKYESCTPAMQNIRHEQDVRVLHFIPYDDARFLERKLRGFAANHAVFAWQLAWHDVDFELIALEAVCRLHSAGLSLDQLDQCAVAFFPRIGGPDGLLASSRHRDLLQWGDSFASDTHAQLAALAQLQPPPPAALARSVDDMTALFCASANCHEALCLLHRQRYPPFALKAPSGTHKDLRRATPCGPSCFRAQEAEDFSDVVEVNSEIYEALRLFPNESSCNIARLCRTTCIAVFVHRELVLPDEDTPSSFVPRWPPSALAKLPFCIHEGPCTTCVCAQKAQRCQRRCRCQCRTTGCRCKECVSGVCPCSLKNTECSPEFCSARRAAGTGTGAGAGKRHKHWCALMPLQTKMPKNLAVRQGSFGLGTFATADIPKDCLLGEYVGEYIEMPLSREARTRADAAQGVVSTHRGLNYLFNLAGDAQAVLDAATVGNPTRCLNHPPEGTEPNVTAEETIVDGDVKIYFKTADQPVKKGRELMLHYGNDYWIDQDDDDDDE